jgi:hypothetical protein
VAFGPCGFNSHLRYLLVGKRQGEAVGLGCFEGTILVIKLRFKGKE